MAKLKGKSGSVTFKDTGDKWLDLPVFDVTVDGEQQKGIIYKEKDEKWQWLPPSMPDSLVKLVNEQELPEKQGDWVDVTTMQDTTKQEIFIGNPYQIKSSSATTKLGSMTKLEQKSYKENYEKVVDKYSPGNYDPSLMEAWKSFDSSYTLAASSHGPMEKQPICASAHAFPTYVLDDVIPNKSYAVAKKYTTGFHRFESKYAVYYASPDVDIETAIDVIKYDMECAISSFLGDGRTYVIKSYIAKSTHHGIWAGLLAVLVADITEAKIGDVLAPSAFPADIDIEHDIPGHKFIKQLTGLNEYQMIGYKWEA
jgi:hypothetical protein